jgi:hypothetical protein
MENTVISTIVGTSSHTDISRPKRSRHYFDTLNEREIGRSFSDLRAFSRWKEHPYIVLQYTPKSTQK